MKLALYSGGTPNENASMNSHVFELITQSKISTIVYITTPQQKDDYARQWLSEYFAALPNINFVPYYVDSRNSEESIDAMKNAKVLVITGGNTFYIMKYLHESGTDKLLRDFVEREGLLIGFSAGSIIMTPNISLAHIPSYDCDTNDVKLVNSEGIGLIKFEVQPHYTEDEEYDKEMRQYSLTNGRPIYALPDGAGILVQNQKEKMFGTVTMFDAGEKVKVACDC